jgi:tripartite-type tricarboxylate transporter receptor subunit TctC
MKASIVLRWLAAAALLASAAAPAQEKYPARPIRLVVPFAPGGETDLIGRMWAQRIAPLVGGGIVVDNKPGAGGTIGAAEVARARPDGYTLLSGTTTTQVINPAAMSDPPYDPLADFVPITIVSTTPTAIVVNPAVPAKNLRELIALVGAQPGKFSYASAGAGTITNLTGELLKLLGGRLDMVHVPYKGGGPATQDVIAGHVAVGTPILSGSVLAHHRAGRLRILAVNSDARLKAAPDIPTASESGLPEMKVVVFNGIFAPAGTPLTVIEALHRATAAAKADGAFAAELERAGAEMVADSSPEQAARFIQGEVARWKPIIRASGFKVQ